MGYLVEITNEGTLFGNTATHVAERDTIPEAMKIAFAEIANCHPKFEDAVPNKGEVKAWSRYDGRQRLAVRIC